MTEISIIIPVFNIEKYIKKSLDSLIAQTFEDFEVICVNDGSTDKSADILNKYSLKDSRIRVFSKENGGSGSARNLGLKNAKGKYVQFLDGDDYFESTMLEKLYNLAEKFNADIAVCSSRKVDEFGNITETKNPNSPINLYLTPLKKTFSYVDFPEDIFSLIGTMPWNKLYLRKMIMENSLTFPKLIGPDDLCFVYMANICAKKIVVIDDELINYRFNRPGSVQTYRANHASDIIRASIFIKNFLETKGMYKILEKAYLKAFINSIRWEVSLCNETQYNIFLKELKTLLPNDWTIFKSALKKESITIDYLHKFIENKKTFLWGGGFFTQKLLSSELYKNENILGIIDKNEASWGNSIGQYKIYSPEILNKFPNTYVVLMVLNNNESIYPILQKELKENYPTVTLLPNIFE